MNHSVLLFDLRYLLSHCIGNGRVVFDFAKCAKCNYFPVGLTVDTDGYVYVALYYGAAVWKIDPRSA